MTTMPDRPNILFIVDDQHRHDYLGSAGADWVNTPAIDSLAQRGTRFTQCTTNSPICAPSRIALATGYIESYNDISELYDLVEDPDELTNILYQEPKLARTLHNRLGARMNEGKWLR